MRPEMIADTTCTVGEGPIWHPEQKVLYWLDIPKGHVFRYNPADRRHELCHQDDGISSFTIQEDGSLLLMMVDGSVKNWRDGEARTVIARLGSESKYAMNDCIAGPMGQVFLGGMCGEEMLGKVFCIQTDGSVSTVMDNMGEPNGMAFPRDQKSLYVTDTLCRDIYRLDYDPASGTATSPQVFIHSFERDGVPDGLTVDSEGFIWSARWGDACVIRYRPDLTEDRRIEMPVSKVTCLTFGGDDYTDIFITTMGGDNREKNGAEAGALFHINLGIRGVPEFRSKIGAS